MVRAIGQRMIAGGLPQRTGPSRDELLMEARGKLAQLMAGQAQNPPVEPQRMAPARGAPTTGSQQIGPTEYAPDFTAKLDKKGRPRDVPLKSNTDAKGSNLNIYAALGIDPSEGARGIEPKIQKLLNIHREEPWRLTRAQDKILSSIADEDATHRSIDPRDVEARFKGYEFKRQEAEAEEEQEAYEKTAGKREKLQGQQQRAQERKVERERKKAEKENAKAKAEGRAPADMDPAVAKAMAALEAKGVPTWQGKKAPTQADVNAQQDAPDDFAARFPNYKAPAPQATETEDEGEE
jgi:hypothetical protein